MVDVDRRTTTSSMALRRLSTRAASLNSPSSSSALHSFNSLASTILSHLAASSSVPITPGLSDRYLDHLEASLGFTFPPDLRTLLSLGVPSGPGFPDWRCRDSIHAAFDFPSAAASLQVAKSSLWPRSWGPRPSDPDRALRAARSAIRRAPLLIPLFDRCYIPCRPCLAGNPVFYVTEERVLCCGLDLLDFFKRDPAFVAVPEPMPRFQESSTPAIANMRRSLDMVAGRSPRWIEFWSDAASDRRRRDSSSSDTSTASTSSSSSSSSSSDSYDQSGRVKTHQSPVWVDSYLDRIGSVLKEAGWEESDVTEMVHVSASDTLAREDVVVVDTESALDALLVKAGRCSDSLRRAGWSSDEVTDALWFGLRRAKNEKRPAVTIPPEIARKMEKLAHSVASSSS